MWILLAVVIVVAAAAAWWLLAGQQVTVPNLAGNTEAEATQALGDVGLKLGEVSQTSDPTAPAGSIVDQAPAAGTGVDEGSSVDVTVSRGSERAKVPDVTGMKQSEAESALVAAGFVPQAALEHDLQTPSGLVMAQLPAADEQAYLASPVGILVSKGTPNVDVSVPDVAGMTESEAVTALANSALHAVRVTAHDAAVPKGVVAAQEPGAGTSLPALSQVAVLVSRGDGMVAVTVPSVVGQKRSAATSTLKAIGLRAKTAAAYGSSVPKGVVMGQTPASGTKVQSGTAVGLAVSLGKAPSPQPPVPTPPPGGGTKPPTEPGVPLVKVPGVTGQTSGQAVAALEKLGLEPISLDAPSQDVAKGIVMAQLPEAGEIVPATFPVLLLVSTGPPAATQLPVDA
jgi:serine/threonine-protein kinase